jgi:hypothetical protein
MRPHRNTATVFNVHLFVDVFCVNIAFKVLHYHFIRLCYWGAVEKFEFDNIPEK